MPLISVTDAVRMIEASHGRIFTAEFIKRTTGEPRVINCRTEVDKFLHGGAPAYDPAVHDLITVCDMALVQKHEQPYRKIPLEGLKRLVIAGCTYDVGQPCKACHGVGQGCTACHNVGLVQPRVRLKVHKAISGAMGLVPKGGL